MKQFKMKPFRGPVDICVSVPGSKSITNRALLLAALTEGKSVLKGVLFSDDSRVFMEALRTLGYEIEVDEDACTVTIEGHGTCIPEKNGNVYVGSAGTAARFLTAMLALSGGHYEVTSSDQMKTRPMKPLLLALEALGVKFRYNEKPYAFPFTILGREENDCKQVFLNIDESSQFLSALLLNGVFCENGLNVELTGKRDAKAYVKISMRMMREFGCEMRQLGENSYEILQGQHYRAQTYQIEPDVSAACYFYAMAAVNQGQAKVRDVFMDSMQGDIQFLRVLEKMGCTLKEEKDGVRLENKKELTGVTERLSDFSDQTMTLAVVCAFAAGKSVITGVGHIRRQESDRLHGIYSELTRLGVSCRETEDGIEIMPGGFVCDKEHPVVIQTYEDHRMAMAFAIIGTKLEGVVIDDPMCCRKTFENYFEILTNLDLSLE
ncbi:MAG: 3-phosphoshikimate 1-carboxyvinyltransferase [Eubacterium sp.]|nr:3-phosphoshikimate 1-carboxyvinyltransferase [Eubacterium sp.]